MKSHLYKITTEWTGNKGEGTASYRAYDRNHIVHVQGKADILGSSDPSFRGDATRHNPEELFVSSLSTCHMLWYLHLCAEAGVVVTEYVDEAEGVMEESASGGGRFTSVTFHPKVKIADESMRAKADELHEQANKLCFIANSCNFPVKHHAVSFI